MPLYRVQVTYETVVLARDGFEAASMVNDSTEATEIFEDSLRRTDAYELTSRDFLPPRWTPNCHPYGDDLNTIAHYLK